MNAKGDGLDPIRECLAGLRSRAKRARRALRGAEKLTTLDNVEAYRADLRADDLFTSAAADSLAAALKRAEGVVELGALRAKAALADALVDRMGYTDEGDPIAFLGSLLDELSRLEDGE